MKIHRSAEVRLIIGALPHPVFLYAPDGTIAAVNPAAERMAGTSPAGRTVEEMIASLGVCHPDGTLVAVHDFPAVRALTGQVVIDCPLTITAADGIVFAIRASASPILCDGVVGVLSTWSDVTDLSKALDDQQRRRTEAEVQARRQEVMAETLAQQYEEIQAQDEELRQHLDELARSQAALLKSEQRVRRTLECLLSLGKEILDLEIIDILDIPALQELIGKFHCLTGIPVSIIDLRGRILIGAGWQECCTQFHRVHPETCRFCVESDLELSAGIQPGESRLYRCRNNMWDIATPITVGGRHMGNIFSGQFFFEDEEPDYDLFLAQARRYGFDEEAYIAAIRVVPRLKRETVEVGMAFLRQLAGLISSQSYSNLRLARTLAERDALTASLERSRSLLARAQEIAHLGAWELDLATNNLSWSDEVYRIFGLVPAEFEATYEAFLEAVHPADRTAADGAYLGSLREGRDCYEIEHRVMRHATGEVRWVHEKCEHQRDGAGQIVRSIGMVHDITELKQAQVELHRRNEDLGAQNEELQMQEEELRVQTEELAQLNADLTFQHDLLDTIFATVPQHVSVWDRDGRYVWMNEQVASGLKRQRDDMIGKTRQEIGLDLTTGEPFMTEVRQVIVTGEPFTTEVPYLYPGGVRWRTYSIHRMPAGEQVVVVSSDITDRKEAEQSLKDYAERLRASNKELQQFAYVASHDLQEPLRSIVGFSQILARRYGGRLDEDADEYLRYIVDGGQRMQALIGDLLQVSRIETAARPFEPTKAGEIVTYALRSLEKLLAEAGGSVVVEAMPTVMADAAQLEQVFMNLIGNGIKYRRPEVPPAITISAKRHHDWWEFAIADNGIGIESEYFNRIFEMFRRLHTHDEYEGTGIGLAIVKKIVERHGGRVQVGSLPGEGSTFFFTLPAV